MVPSDLLDTLDTALSNAVKDHEIDRIKADYLGQKSWVRSQLQALGKIEPKERVEKGRVVHGIREKIQKAIDERRKILREQAQQRQLESERIDTTRRVDLDWQGGPHPLRIVQDKLMGIFTRLGFECVTGPEVETAYYNFTALNTPEYHPARTVQDTLYIEGEDDALLRSHTTCVQARLLAEQKPPLRVISVGRVFRADTPDATHSPCFSQLEGLVVDEKSTLLDLKQTLEVTLSEFFSQEIQTRFRPSFFPFTEPSLECDIHFRGRWLELLGCGMVHPWVLENAGLDSGRFQGYAFGIGLDRLCMLAYGIEDIRDLYTGDCEFLAQFAEAL